MDATSAGEDLEVTLQSVAEGQEISMTANEFRASFWTDGNPLELQNNGGCTTLLIYF